MGENKVDLFKGVFNKNQYPKIIDTDFKELGVSNIIEDIQSQPSVEEFFRLYNELFYDIPPKGDINSHEYLINQSEEYIGFEQNNEEIEALQKEISELRKELLASQIKNTELISGQSLNISLED